MQEHALELLRLLETPGVGTARVHSLADLARNDPSEFLNVFRDRLRLRKVLSERQLEELTENETRVADEWQQLQTKNVRFLSILDEAYPVRLRALLGKKAPALLMALGNVDLLSKPSVGFCGSRKASEKGLATATDCADQLARQGVNIVSGYAAGVDMATHRSALAAGGTTTLVLCEGILQFAMKRDLKDLWDWERIAVVTEFLPGIPWSVRNAMQRNQTICALSVAMILIESGATGGSIEAGRSALKMGIPLFAPVYEGMPESAVGNRELLGQGARPLHKSQKTGRANLRGVLSVVEEGSLAPAGAPPQYWNDAAPPLLLFEPKV